MTKFTLRRVPLNLGGYDQSGRYWGRGAPLWRYCADGLSGHFRANTREDAKAFIRAAFPGATFYR